MSADSGDASGDATTSWQPPVGPLGHAGPQYRQPSTPTASSTAWMKPSQPGLVPLRPMTLGTLLSASFRAVRRNPRPLLGLALSTQFLVMVLSAGVLVASLFLSAMRLETVSAENAAEVSAGSVLALVLSTFVPGLVGVAVVAFLQGVVVLDVSRAVLGEKLTLRQLWRRGRGRFWALIGWMLLIFGAVGVVLAVIAAIAVLFAVTMGAVGVALAVAVAVLCGLGLLVVAVWLGTKLSLVPSALMVERLRLGAAIARSWRLTDRYFWRTFGVQALVAVILSVAMQIVMTPISFLLPMLIFIIDPNGTNDDLVLSVFLGSYVVIMAITTVLTAFATVVQSATNGLIYIDLRMRKEGLELDLSRFVEEREAGAASLDDPYLPQRVAPQGAAWSATPTGSPWQ
ncbi:hypothetical protein FVA74_04260 [Salinibacterium sp. dk2585]|uniref:hypothetical protein n=1 Tax=unclassified Salinibacterium TaxID=2632331 RepID=UPI0011C24DE8|nr:MULTISPECIES: hypothetical protein [unclassified Salinibacterium]QEE60881.1 hypothetical protein FVA74_04260 [Salinibacterium sp. dk2585]TXK55952.1 hypothetical protein FVP63_04405 [Salinibacterium sp. dk5596]